MQKAKQYAYYVVKKDLSILKNCTKHNYKTTLKSFDGYVLKPGEIVNLNKHISYLPGYCKGSGPKDLMFYGGVCGFASQLFRISLISPDIYINKRFGHSVWLTSYYSDYIYGDDAALYQMGKQLEIKNQSDQNIYFKSLDKGNYNYFVAIYPLKNTQGVNISKTQINVLGAQIIKEIYDLKSNQSISQQVFDSKYDSKSSVVR